MKYNMINMPEIKAAIASCATNSENNIYGRFYKSYITEVRIKNSSIGINGLPERMFSFNYKGKMFEVSEKCTGQFSLMYKYYIKEVIQ